MTDDTDKRGWAADYIQIGTNERKWVEAPTREELHTKIYGQAYGPKFGTIVYYRTGAKQ